LASAKRRPPHIKSTKILGKSTNWNIYQTSPNAERIGAMLKELKDMSGVKTRYKQKEYRLAL
jgi:hypothetical protein